MTVFERIYRSNFLIKLRSWEYWPFGIVQAPFFVYWLWLSLKARSLFFFSASNPSIFSGGMMGESKFDVLKLVPKQFQPQSILVKFPSQAEDLLSRIQQSSLTFPLIFKPDLGERGWMVRKINNEEEVKKYLTEINTDFLIQEFIDLPLEFGVFYVRKPSDETGKIVSITSKEMLSVVGDGKSPMGELIRKNDRAKLQVQRLSTIFASQWNDIIPEGKIIELNSIGNHCLGTKFLNGNSLITDRMTESFDNLSKQISGFYFGRFDLRCASLKDLEQGNIMIMELNGCGAEPAHIYQPGFSLWNALKVMRNHWRTLYEVSVENHKRGVTYLTFSEARRNYVRTRSILGKS